MFKEYDQNQAQGNNQLPFQSNLIAQKLFNERFFGSFVKYCKISQCLNQNNLLKAVFKNKKCKHCIQTFMINHHQILKQQLRKIANSINKKHTVLKKQVIKTSDVFQNNNLPVFPYQVCFGLFKVLLETGSVNTITQFFPFLQNLINLGFSNEDMSREILTLLNQLKSLPKFQGPQNEIRLQQMLMLLISKNTIALDKMSFSHSIINILFSLQNAKNKTIWHKSLTAVTQIIALCINCLQDNQTPENKKQLSEFIKDLISMCKGQCPKWFIQVHDPYIIYNALNQIYNNKYIIQNKQQWKQLLMVMTPDLRKTLKKVLDTNHPTTVLGSSRSHDKNHWELSPQDKIIILLRTACKNTRVFHEGFDILQQIVKLLTEKHNSYWKILGYEAVDYIFNDAHWMHDLLKSPFADLFNFLLTTQFNNIKGIFTDHKDKVDMINQKSDPPKIFFKNGLEFVPCQFTVTSQVKMIVRNIQIVSYTLYAIYYDILKLPLEKNIQEEPPLFKTYRFCQKTVFEMIKVTLPRDMNEDTLQSILKTTQKFINLSGSFKDYTTTTMYIKLVCKYCLPPDFKTIIKHRHVQINKMILNTVNCLGNLLNPACWVIVWKALQNYTLYYNRYSLAKQQHLQQRKTDIQILYKTMDAIFTQSPKYNEQYLLNIIESLIQVTYQCLENNYREDAKKIFSFERIQQIYRLNLHRITIMWPLLSSSLLCITTSKVSEFRVSALDLLNTLIPVSLQYLSSHPESLKDKFTKQNFQILIFEPWTNLVKCQFQQLRNELVLAVNKIIIDYGHILQYGWKSILHVVAQMQDLKSLQAIVQTFLEKVDQHITQILLIVDNIQRGLQDTNQKYLCLTLIWAIGDHAHKHNHPQILRKIYGILLQPDVMFSLGTQARHSSFYIFAQLIVHNCIQNTPNFWQQVFTEVQQFCTYGVNRSLQSTDKKQAQEAIKNILVNLIKIYRIFFMVSDEWKKQQKDELIQKKLKNFYQLCSKILKFRQNQIYQCLIKQMKQILALKPQQSAKVPEFITFLESLTEAYFVDFDNKILKCLITYIPVDVYDILTKSLGLIKYQKNLGVVYKLIQKVFLLRLQAEQKDIRLAQARIFFQQKHFNQFWKKFHNYITTECKQMIAQYFEKIVKTLHTLLLYEDYNYLSKMFQYATGIVIDYSSEIQKDTFLDMLSKVVSLKYDEIWIKKFSGFKDVPIWYIACQQLLKISFQFISRKDKAAQKSYYTLLSIIKGKNEKSSIFSLGSVQCISFYYQNQIAVTNFLIDNYFYHLSQTQQDLYLKNEDFEFILSNLNKQSHNFDQKDQKNWAKNSYDLLIKLANKRQEQYTKTLTQRYLIVVKMLFERLLQSFDSLFALESLISTSNSSQTIKVQSEKSIDYNSIKENPITNQQIIKARQQIKFILRKMPSITLKEGILTHLEEFLNRKIAQQINIKAKVFQSPKAHIFYFNLCISKCIKSNDTEIRHQVCELYEEIGKMLLNMQ